MRVKGFTIIEVVIAIAISIILVAIAVPRYDQFSNQQDFNTSVEKLVKCMQIAQQAAASPPANSSYRFTGVVMKPNSVNSDNMDCATYTYSSSTFSTSDGTTSDPATSVLLDDAGGVPLSTSVTIPNIQLSGVTVPDYPVKNYNIPANNNPPAMLRIYFGVYEKGAPVVYVPCAVANTNCQNTYGIYSADSQTVANPNTPVPFTYEKGFSLQLAVQNSNALTQLVTMGRFGVPISLSN